MLNLGGWLNEKAEDLYDDAEYDMTNGHPIKGAAKAFLSGNINGVTNGLIVNGILLTAFGIITIIANKKSEN